MRTHRDEIPSGSVVLYTTTLDPPAERVDALRALLSADERARAASFRFPQHQRRFAVARGLLRELLGSALSLRPQEIELAEGSYGKPVLGGPLRAHPLRFNLSHSEELAVFALTLTGEIGVDVEHIRPLPDMWGLAARCFAPPELAALSRLPDDERVHGFFRAWTRKEAVIKADGAGLSWELLSFATVPAAAPNEWSVEAFGDPRRAALYSVREFMPAPRYAAAVAVTQPGLALIHRSA
jgi:4'-phosphopantetheinyl transferase